MLVKYMTKKCFKTSFIAVVIKILFEFTPFKASALKRCKKIKFIVIQDRGGGLYLGGVKVDLTS